MLFTFASSVLLGNLTLPTHRERILTDTGQSPVGPWPSDRQGELELPVVGPVVPGLVGEVAAEEAPQLFRARVLAVE